MLSLCVLCTGKRFAIGRASTYVIDDKGKLLGYGWSDIQEDWPDVGDEEGEMGENLPEIDFGGDDSFVIDVSAGDHYACAVLYTGALYCWGRNHLGQVSFKYDFLIFSC